MPSINPEGYRTSYLWAKCVICNSFAIPADFRHCYSNSWAFGAPESCLGFCLGTPCTAALQCGPEGMDQRPWLWGFYYFLPHWDHEWHTWEEILMKIIKHWFGYPHWWPPLPQFSKLLLNPLLDSHSHWPSSVTIWQKVSALNVPVLHNENGTHKVSIKLSCELVYISWGR